jgi:hypothetical protein
VGTGSFTVGSFHAPFAAHAALEFVKSVGPDQTVTMQSGIGFAIVDVDRPQDFHAAIRWETNDGAVNLKGLLADSYTRNAITNDLTFYSGANVVDTVKVIPGDPTFYSAFHVSQGTTGGGIGVDIHSASRDINDPVFGPDLPLHV